MKGVSAIVKEIESPYPRQAGGTFRTRPPAAPLWRRLSADAWTLLLGGVYGLVSLAPHWSVTVLVPIAVAWRAFRVERMKVDFAPRTVALVALGWLAMVWFGTLGGGALNPFSNRSPFEGVVVGTMAGGGPAWLSPEESAWFNTLCIRAGLIGILWVTSIIYRRMTRATLEPAGAYESVRATTTWLLIPALLMVVRPIADVIMVALTPLGWSIATILLVSAASLRLGRSPWERLASAATSVGLFYLSWEGNSNIAHNFDSVVGGTLRVDLIASVVMMGMFAVLFGILQHRNRKNLQPVQLGGIPETAVTSDDEDAPFQQTT